MHVTCANHKVGSLPTSSCIFHYISHKPDFFFLSEIFLVDFALLQTEILPIWQKKNLPFLACWRKKLKKKTLKSQFFFSSLIRHVLSSSEESWTKEYSECCLICVFFLYVYEFQSHCESNVLSLYVP